MQMSDILTLIEKIKRERQLLHAVFHNSHFSNFFAKLVSRTVSLCISFLNELKKLHYHANIFNDYLYHFQKVSLYWTTGTNKP